jgi:glycerol-3-phosphate acyltransferase PlsX
MRIGVDAMGGDHAPGEIVRGVQQGLQFLAAGDEIVLYGVQEAMEAHCRQCELNDPRVKLVHCAQVIEMDDSPVEALRQKRHSSIVQLAVDAADEKLDAVISAGNTGAFAAACQLKVGAIEGVSRPGIAVVCRRSTGRCDLRRRCQVRRSRTFYEYCADGACMTVILRCRAAHRGGLVGEEAAKGNPLVKEARAIIKQDATLRFVGNVEGRDIFGGHCDIAVCDGFVGNVILKLTEGLAEGLFKTIVHEIKEESLELVPRFEPIVDRIWKRHDFAEYGGAPLLGLRKIAIICHGRSDHRAMNNAIRVAVEQVRLNIITAIATELRRRHEDAA